MIELEELRLLARGIAEMRLEAEVTTAGYTLPIYSFVFGPKDRNVPTLALIGGVHGLERIGASVVLCYMRTLIELLHWDKGIQHLLQNCRIVFMPMVNPAGVFQRSRSNPNGVDLMRNAPIDAEMKPNVRLVCGHRISPKLPWYRGAAGEPMEKESTALVELVKREVFPSRFSIALDLHSGFGLMDRLWFPFAYTHRPFDRIAEMHALKTRLGRSLPNHPYLMEPQSKTYVTHGDLWDHLWLEHQRSEHAPRATFLPLTLEMGSWIWVKKNPRQAFSALGIFNPLLPHRIQRTLRRHLGLLDFLVRAVASYDNWALPSHLAKGGSDARAMALWYPQHPGIRRILPRP